MNTNLKEIIIENIKQAQAMGWRLVYGKWVNDKDKCACALGCVLVNQDDYSESSSLSFADRAKRYLGVDEDWVVGFFRGFDGMSDPYGKDRDAFKMGQEVRKEMSASHWESIASFLPY